MAREPVLVAMGYLGLDSGLMTAPTSGWNVSGSSTNLVKEYPAATGGRSGAIDFSRRPEAACKMAAAGRGIVKAASWSDFEACVTNLPGDVRKVAVAEQSVIDLAVAGGKGKQAAGKDKQAAGGGKAKPAADGGKAKPAADGGKAKPSSGADKAKPAGTRRTKLVQVGQRYIDNLLEFRASNPHHKMPAWNAEMMETIYKDKPEALEKYRKLHAKVAANVKASKERDDEILKQYKAYGSAYVEVKVSDDEN